MLKKMIKITVIALAAAFVVLQFFQIDKTNPAVIEAETLEAAVAVPSDIALIVGRSCNDCHTSKTIYPWYAYIQPSGWFLKGHIDDGKRKLNLSHFNTFDLKKKVKKLEEICDEVESGRMPLPSYLWIHRDAGLSESERKAVCDWAKQEIERLKAGSE